MSPRGLAPTQCVPALASDIPLPATLRMSVLLLLPLLLLFLVLLLLLLLQLWLLVLLWLLCRAGIGCLTNADACVPATMPTAT